MVSVTIKKDGTDVSGACLLLSGKKQPDMLNAAPAPPSLDVLSHPESKQASGKRRGTQGRPDHLLSSWTGCSTQLGPQTATLLSHAHPGDRRWLIDHVLQFLCLHN